MKKVTLFFGALVLGLILTSCENKKDTAVKLFNNFFDEEVAYLNKVEDADAFLTYFDEADKRFDEFYSLLDKKCPLNEEGDFIDMNKEDSDATMAVFDGRMDDYVALRDAKSEVLYEPIVAELENYWYDKMVPMLDQYENAEDIPDEVFNPLYDEFEALFDKAEKYVRLSSNEQFDRFYEYYDLFYADEDGEEVAEETEAAE